MFTISLISESDDSDELNSDELLSNDELDLDELLSDDELDSADVLMKYLFRDLFKKKWFLMKYKKKKLKKNK